MTQVLRAGGEDTRRVIAHIPGKRFSPPPKGNRRVGYLAAALVNGALLWLVNHLLGWGWPPFLTHQFEDLLPWIRVSLVATIAVNLLWTWRDPAWLKHLAQLALNAIALVVIVRSWQIFPVDFTGSWSGWETIARIAIGIAFFGVVVDTVTRLVALGRAARDHGETHTARAAASRPRRSRQRSPTE